MLQTQEKGTHDWKMNYTDVSIQKATVGKNNIFQGYGWFERFFAMLLH